MTCFRALSELRDAPRLKEILRAAPPAQPPAGDPFWDDLAARVAAAADRPAASSGVEPVQAVARRPRRRIAGGLGVAGVAFLAAAAAWVVAVRRPTVPSPVAPQAVTLSAIASPAAADDASEAFDVGELDRATLERLANHLRRNQHLATYTAGDEADVEEEVELHDELAELDAPALLRVERSLARTAL
jgi:hypothetical protein